MDHLSVAKVYAKALIEIAVESKSLDSLQEELQDASKSLKSDEEVWNFILSPKISREDKTRVLLASFENRSSETIRSLIKLLIKNDRIIEFEDIAKQFSVLHDSIKGRVRARIYSANKLQDPEITQIKSILSEKLGGECILEQIIAPELIGGIVIRYQDKKIDGSIQNRLSLLKQNLLQLRATGANYEN